MAHQLLQAAYVRWMIQLALKRVRGGELLRRLDAVLLVAEGRTVCEVAEWFSVNHRTLERWVHAAYLRGVDGLVEHHCGGRPAKLAQINGIWQDLRSPPNLFGYHDRRWSGKRLALHLDKYYRIKMSVRNCQRIISRSRADLTSR